MGEVRESAEFFDSTEINELLHSTESGEVLESAAVLELEGARCKTGRELASVGPGLLS